MSRSVCEETALDVSSVLSLTEPSTNSASLNDDDSIFTPNDDLPNPYDAFRCPSEYKQGYGQASPASLAIPTAFLHRSRFRQHKLSTHMAKNTILQVELPPTPAKDIWVDSVVPVPPSKDSISKNRSSSSTRDLSYVLPPIANERKDRNLHRRQSTRELIGMFEFKDRLASSSSPSKRPSPSSKVLGLLRPRRSPPSSPARTTVPLSTSTSFSRPVLTNSNSTSSVFRGSLQNILGALSSKIKERKSRRGELFCPSSSEHTTHVTKLWNGLGSSQKKKEGRLAYLQLIPFSAEPATWTHCNGSLEGTQLKLAPNTTSRLPTGELISSLVTLTPVVQIFDLSACYEVHSVPAVRLTTTGGIPKPWSLEKREMFVFEIELDGGKKECFAAESIKERGAWVSLVWDLILERQDLVPDPVDLDALMMVVQPESPLTQDARRDPPLRVVNNSTSRISFFSKPENGTDHDEQSILYRSEDNPLHFNEVHGESRSQLRGPKKCMEPMTGPSILLTPPSSGGLINKTVLIAPLGKTNEGVSDLSPLSKYNPFHKPAEVHSTSLKRPTLHPESLFSPALLSSRASTIITDIVQASPMDAFSNVVPSTKNTSNKVELRDGSSENNSRCPITTLSITSTPVDHFAQLTADETVSIAQGPAVMLEHISRLRSEVGALLNDNRATSAVGPEDMVAMIADQLDPVHFKLDAILVHQQPGEDTKKSPRPPKSPSFRILERKVDEGLAVLDELRTNLTSTASNANEAELGAKLGDLRTLITALTESTIASSEIRSDCHDGMPKLRDLVMENINGRLEHIVLRLDDLSRDLFTPIFDGDATSSNTGSAGRRPLTIDSSSPLTNEPNLVLNMILGKLEALQRGGFNNNSTIDSTLSPPYTTPLPLSPPLDLNDKIETETLHSKLNALIRICESLAPSPTLTSTQPPMLREANPAGFEEHHTVARSASVFGGRYRTHRDRSEPRTPNITPDAVPEIAHVSDISHINLILDDQKQWIMEQGQHQAESIRYLHDLNQWLERFVQKHATQMEAVSDGVAQLLDNLGFSSQLPSNNGAITPAPFRLDVHSTLAGIYGMVRDLQERQNGQEAIHNQLFGLLRKLDAGIEQLSQQNTPLSSDVMMNMLHHQKQEHERMVKGLAEEISHEIRGERLKFIDAMREATTVNLDHQITQFKEQLSKEVVGMEQELSDLLAVRYFMKTQPQAT